MPHRFFIGNIAPEATEQGLRDYFVARGLAVTHVSIILDRSTGQSRGFGFVEIASAADAETAMDALEDTTIDGRLLTVRRVDERERRH